MSYLVLARKYRPQNFDQLVGQEVLVKVLTNAILSDKTHHAYILTGIRGVGKTTTARIIAKILNCSNPVGVSSCGVCNNCTAITASQHQDVIEIDAASRTGVDDIRAIIDSIAYAPVMAKYKIYIIDEVHMLSNSAFNALLKTLEEPPAKVKFIFATTEIRKVPITILSRCQRFDLRRLDESEVALHLKNILGKENLTADDAALELIAKMSEGSVRDSLSLLDQALSINNYQQFLPAEVVEKMLSVTDKMKIIELLELLLAGDFTAALYKFHEIYSTSSDVVQIIGDVLEILNKIILSKAATNYKLDGYSVAQKTKIGELAQKTSLASLNRIWQMFLKGSTELSYSISPKMIFEILLNRICYLNSLPSLKDSLVEFYHYKSPIVVADAAGSSKAIVDTKSVGDDVVNEILRNFEGSKLIN